jgi:hypothetical protein
MKLLRTIGETAWRNRVMLAGMVVGGLLGHYYGAYMLRLLNAYMWLGAVVFLIYLWLPPRGMVTKAPPMVMAVRVMMTIVAWPNLLSSIYHYLDIKLTVLRAGLEYARHLEKTADRLTGTTDMETITTLVERVQDGRMIAIMRDDGLHIHPTALAGQVYTEAEAATAIEPEELRKMLVGQLADGGGRYQIVRL